MDLVRLFALVDSCEVTPDQHFYDLLLSSLTKSGHVDRAVGYIKRAHKKGTKFVYFFMSPRFLLGACDSSCPHRLM